MLDTPAQIAPEPLRAVRPPLFLFGCDLGQSADYTALSVLELAFVDTGRTESFGLPPPCIRGKPTSAHQTRPVWQRHYAVRHLERLPRGTPYPAQVDRIRELFMQLRQTTSTSPPPHLIVDSTGVGRAVTDLLRQAGLNPIAVTITAGDATNRDGNSYRVPKRDLVASTQVLLQSGRLKISKALPHSQLLVDELLAFRVTFSQRGHDSYGNDTTSWREADHDDLVLSVALAAWYGETVASSDL